MSEKRMDYTRIDTLLAQYWRCATTVEEERELRLFFTHEEVPPALRPYRAWFRLPEAEELYPLGSQFDREILEHIRKEKRSRRRKRCLKLFIGLLAVLLLSALFLLFFFPAD